MKPGTRIRVAIKVPSEYSGVERLDGATGVIVDHPRPHSDGHLLVEFDEPRPSAWSSGSPVRSFWFPARDLEPIT